MTKFIYVGIILLIVTTLYITLRHTEPIQNFEQNALGVLSKDKGYLFKET